MVRKNFICATMHAWYLDFLVRIAMSVHGQEDMCLLHSSLSCLTLFLAISPSAEEDAPTYVYVAVGSAVGIIMYILTIVLIGLLIWLKIKGTHVQLQALILYPQLPTH